VIPSTVALGPPKSVPLANSSNVSVLTTLAAAKKAASLLKTIRAPEAADGNAIQQRSKQSDALVFIMIPPLR
jgi:hypothetical protein